jgi:hypothetical protein
MCEKSNAQRILVGKPEGDRLLVRPWRIQGVNIKVYFRKEDGVGWIHLAQDTDQWQALMNSVMNFLFP